jgi:hypothetical protein
MSQDTRRLLSEARAAPPVMSGTMTRFEDGDIRELNVIFLDLARGVRWAEIPLLAHNFSKRVSAVRRPSQHELLGTLYFVFLKDQGDASKPLRLIKDSRIV